VVESIVSEHTEVPVSWEAISVNIEVPVRWEEMSVNIQKCE